MKIRINKCTDARAWYANRVGQTLAVERVEINRDPSQGIPEDVYWCREGGTYNCLNYVRASDATEVPAKEAAWQAYKESECFESDGRANGFSKGYDAGLESARAVVAEYLAASACNVPADRVQRAWEALRAIAA